MTREKLLIEIYQQKTFWKQCERQIFLKLVQSFLFTDETTSLSDFFSFKAKEIQIIIACRRNFSYLLHPKLTIKHIQNTDNNFI